MPTEENNILAMFDGDLAQSILKLDKLQRAQELIGSVKTSLSRIRTLKMQLESEQSNLRELLKTNIQEDESLKELLSDAK